MDGKQLLTEDEVRNLASRVLKLDVNEKDILQGTGQITTFNQLGFAGVPDKPDGWYLPEDDFLVAIVLEVKGQDKNLQKKPFVKELFKNCDVVLKKYKNVIGLLYNGRDVRVFINKEENFDVSKELQDKEYYLELVLNKSIDKQRIYTLTKRINDCLHSDFGIRNLYHRMIFTACALVAKRYNAILDKNMDFSLMKNSILTTLSKSLDKDKKQKIQKNPYITP